MVHKLKIGLVLNPQKLLNVLFSTMLLNIEDTSFPYVHTNQQYKNSSFGDTYKCFINVTFKALFVIDKNQMEALNGHWYFKTHVRFCLENTLGLAL